MANESKKKCRRPIFHNKARCYSLPHSKLEYAINLIENGVVDPEDTSVDCRRNLFMMQMSKLNGNITKTLRGDGSIFARFNKSLRSAILSHNWEKLHFLLKSFPLKDYNYNYVYSPFHLYLRAYIILLLNHPSAKSQSLILDYLHLVLSCRTDEQKKAFIKLMVSLPEKIPKYLTKVQFLQEMQEKKQREAREMVETSKNEIVMEE